MPPSFLDQTLRPRKKKFFNCAAMAFQVVRLPRSVLGQDIPVPQRYRRHVRLRFLGLPFRLRIGAVEHKFFSAEVALKICRNKPRDRFCVGVEISHENRVRGR